MNLCVDSKGYYLICLNKVTKVNGENPIGMIIVFCFEQETECFDIALIHDTRTGPEAILPRVSFECLNELICFSSLSSIRVLTNVNN